MRTYFVFFFVLVKLTSCQRRIVGGTDAEDGMYPYAAFILVNKVASCTGSLLTEEWVLTAAHCMGNKPLLIEVIAGAANKRSEKAQSRKGKEVVIHGKYAPMQLAGYDIALIKVDNPFNMSSLNIGTISLSSEEWPQDNQMHVNCKVLGWGRISTNGKSPDVLQHQDVVAKHGTDGCPCVKRFEQKRLVCIEGMVGKGPCMGDSGGPLVCNGKEVGITHMGFNRQKCNPIYHQIPKTTCGDKDTVVTYLYLCPELNWIRKFVPVVPAKPESCSAIVHRRYNLYFITVLEIFVVYVVNIF